VVAVDKMVTLAQRAMLGVTHLLRVMAVVLVVVRRLVTVAEVAVVQVK
tara:strand:- start:212 stop:355 length:144 start_codon:yes stop_codon:yes gene_type:complete